jgi:hypothetical protein
MALVVVWSIASPGVVLAQGATGTPPAAGQSDVERARVHYDRGIQLFNEENYDAALFEFERAYELAPSYKILYNMARIQRQLNNYAAALQNFRRYLAEGGNNIPDERKKEVDREIEMLKPRVATIDIKANVDGADVYLDDSPLCTGTQTGCVGKSPLPAPITVNPGRRKVTAQKSGYAPGTAVVRVVGSDAVTAKVDLAPLAEVDRSADPAAKTRAIVGWSATGAFAVAGAVTGVFALNAQSKLKTDRDAPEQDPAVLSNDSRKVKSLSLAADVLGGVAVLAGLVSTYLTVKAFQQAARSSPEKPDQAATVKLEVGPNGAFVLGSF